MVDIPKPTLRHVNNICIKVLTSQNKPVKTLVALSLYETTQKIKDKNPINWFLQLDSIALENFDEEHEQNSDRKLRKRKY